MMLGASFPDWGEHLALAMQIQQQMNFPVARPGPRPITLRTVPGSTSKLTKGSLLEEVGGQWPTPWRRALAGARLFARFGGEGSGWSGWRNRTQDTAPGGESRLSFCTDGEQQETGPNPVWFRPCHRLCGMGKGEAWPAAPRAGYQLFRRGGRGSLGGAVGVLPGWEGSAGTWVPTGSVGCSGGLRGRGALPQGEPPPPEGSVRTGSVVLVRGGRKQGVDGIVLVPHLKVAVGPSGRPGRAHRSDGLDTGDGIPHLGPGAWSSGRR